MIKKPHFCLIFLVVVILLVPAFNVEGVFAEDLVVTTSTFSDAVSSTLAVVTTTLQMVSATSERTLIAEPTIRVGLYKTADTIIFRSEFPYEVISGPDPKGILSTNEEAELSYTAGVYHFKSASLAFDSPHYLRLVPGDKSYHFTLVNDERRLKGRGDKNFNAYRDALEYRYSLKSRLPYIINELPLDEYVAGIMESADSVPAEYAKALLVAARSYAYANISGSAPTEKRLFDVFPTTVDQLYLGYNSELTMPHIVVAAAATAGEMVTYNGVPVTTPYFGHSNGRTTSWKTKFKTDDHPWLKSVLAPYDKGKKKWGHGIGMSTHDAEMRALKDGWSYIQILKYYYTGVEVEKIF